MGWMQVSSELNFKAESLFLSCDAPHHGRHGGTWSHRRARAPGLGSIFPVSPPSRRVGSVALRIKFLLSAHVPGAIEP